MSDVSYRCRTGGSGHSRPRSPGQSACPAILPRPAAMPGDLKTQIGHGTRSTLHPISIDVRSTPAVTGIKSKPKLRGAPSIKVEHKSRAHRMARVNRSGCNGTWKYICQYVVGYPALFKSLCLYLYIPHPARRAIWVYFEAAGYGLRSLYVSDGRALKNRLRNGRNQAQVKRPGRPLLPPLHTPPPSPPPSPPMVAIKPKSRVPSLASPGPGSTPGPYPG